MLRVVMPSSMVHSAGCFFINHTQQQCRRSTNLLILYSNSEFPSIAFSIARCLTLSLCIRPKRPRFSAISYHWQHAHRLLSWGVAVLLTSCVLQHENWHLVCGNVARTQTILKLKVNAWHFDFVWQNFTVSVLQHQNVSSFELDTAQPYCI